MNTLIVAMPNPNTCRREDKTNTTATTKHASKQKCHQTTRTGTLDISLCLPLPLSPSREVGRSLFPAACRVCQSVSHQLQYLQSLFGLVVALSDQPPEEEQLGAHVRLRLIRAPCGHNHELHPLYARNTHKSHTNRDPHPLLHPSTQAVFG